MQEKKILLGIVQGRLSNAPKNRLQFFPKKYQNEFILASEIGFDFIEFFSEKKFNIKNPIWKDKLKDNYLQLSKENNLKIYSFCDNYIISNSILQNKNILYIEKLIKKMKEVKIKNLFLPMYGKSLMTDINYKKFINKFKKILNYDDKINIYIESDISPYTFKVLKKTIKSKRFRFLFDTGNRSTLKRNLYEDIKIFGNDISHVHIKDKNENNTNVMLGKGIINFKKIFKSLNSINYSYNFTLETTRDNNFKKSAKLNFNFTKRLITKYLTK